MNHSRIISDSELSNTLTGNTLADRVKALYSHQINNWDLLKTNSEKLDNVQTKEFQFDKTKIIIQNNPERITSTNAKVDAKTIKNRSCFLCNKNLPSEQRAIKYYNDSLILCNPFPIFREHLTIPKIDHIPQHLIHNLDLLIKLTKDLGKYYSIYYNGPECGASAPDHMHFQASPTNDLPILNEIQSYENDETLINKEDYKVGAIDDGIRKYFVIMSEDETFVKNCFSSVLRIFSQFLPNENETKFNLVSSYSNKMYSLIVFPRYKHRPDEYYFEGDKQIIVSPAVIDLAGVCVLPREEDFEKVSIENVRSIFRQVTITKEMFEFIKSKIATKLL